MAKKKIALFGGSFDPLHFGHLNLAIELSEAANINEVLFCPASISPFKIDQQPLFSPQSRIKMVQDGIEGIRGFHVLDFEVENGGTSYTIDTVRYLKEKFEDAELYIILALDLLPKFHLWKEYHEILSLARPLLGGRAGGAEWERFHYTEKEIELINAGTYKIKEMDISSTNIRERLKNKLYCGHLVPAKVLDTIYSFELY